MMASRVDLLSQVLTLIRLRGELIVSAELTAPWALRFDAGSAWFHLISEGEMQVTASDGRVVNAAPGDLLVLSQGRGHVIGTVGATPIPARDVLAEALDHGLALHLGGGGAPARMVTGAFRFEGSTESIEGMLSPSKRKAPVTMRALAPPPPRRMSRPCSST